MNSNIVVSPPSKKPDEILSDARIHICRHFNIFLDAVYNLQTKPDTSLEAPMTTDGIYLYYHPQLLCMLHELQGLEGVVYGMLHLSAHCVLGHLAPRNQVKSTKLYDVLADYKVHKMLSALMGNKKYGNSVKNITISEKLKYHNAPLHIAYHRLIKDKKNVKKYLHCAEILSVDNHALWHRPKQENATQDGKDGKDENNKNSSQAKEKKGAQSEKEMPMQDWNQIKEKIKEGNFQLFAACDEGYGDESGNNCYDYQFDWESELDYKDILQEFLRKSTVEVENPNIIDPVWYYFGLNHLDEVPLIEPLEEDERPTDGTLLLALDTSGSCQGEICEKFLRELDTIMLQLQTMNSLNRVVLFQCDRSIREELVLSSPDDWTEMMGNFQIKGGGGTDFCPVFEEGEKYDDVVGLIYLSDGYGHFPEKAPSYPTLFLLTDEENGHVPYWIQTVPFSEIM